jgi:hypothetical protein
MKEDSLNNTPWRDSFSSHPQFSILESHVQRAVQDLFLVALRSQTDDFICVFDSTEQIDEFCLKMISYWEKIEKYEICSEIQKLCTQLKLTWSGSPKYYQREQEEIMKEWIKSSF